MTAAQEELLERVRARRVLPMAEDRRRIREDAKVSQHEMAKALGVSWTAIWRWENGARPREHRHEVAYVDPLNELKRVCARGGERLRRDARDPSKRLRPPALPEAPTTERKFGEEPYYTHRPARRCGPGARRHDWALPARARRVRGHLRGDDRAARVGCPGSPGQRGQRRTHGGARPVRAAPKAAPVVGLRVAS